ncbi:MAG: IS200/IS605 family transposase [Pseudomonadota bacterium]
MDAFSVEVGSCYNTWQHSVYNHLYHAVFTIKYSNKVLQGRLQFYIREIIGQVSSELGIRTLSGVLLNDHVHIFASIPPSFSVNGFARRVKERSSLQIQ